MTKNQISSGVAHQMPMDLKAALIADAKALSVWEGLTPLARNEWICWVISVKLEETRKQHVQRMCTELRGGKRRPCCWIGCIHRKDKAISPSVRHLLSNKGA